VTIPLGLEHDWYPGSVPSNVSLGRNVYIDTTYAFAAFHSGMEPALTLGESAGAYIRSSFIVGPRGRVRVGAYTIINGSYIVCERKVDIGAHCLFAWGTFITDSWPASSQSAESRTAAVVAASRHPARPFPETGGRPVTIEDNVWVGFDSVILPGVTLGRGCIVGSRTIVDVDVPPYAVVVGNPQRVVRVLHPTDDEAARQNAMKHLRADRP